MHSREDAEAGKDRVSDIALVTTFDSNSRDDFEVASRGFFKKGRVFSTPWAEYRHETSSVVLRIQRFAIIRARASGCLCLALNTYGGLGTSKPGVNPDEHAIVLSDAKGETQKLHKDEKEFNEDPLIIKVETLGEKIDPMLRLNFAKVYTVEYNVKVRNVGRIRSASLPRLESYFADGLNLDLRSRSKASEASSKSKDLEKETSGSWNGRAQPRSVTDTQQVDQQPYLHLYNQQRLSHLGSNVAQYSQQYPESSDLHQQHGKSDPCQQPGEQSQRQYQHYSGQPYPFRDERHYAEFGSNMYPSQDGRPYPSHNGEERLYAPLEAVSHPSGPNRDHHDNALPSTSLQGERTTNLQRHGVRLFNMHEISEDNKLDPNFKVRKSSFFKVGRVFKVLWPELAGDIVGPHRGNVSQIAYGENVYAKVRWFVVVREDLRSCSCLAIQTYGGLGVSKKGLVKSEHAVIFTGKEIPALPEELPTDPNDYPMGQSIKVNPKHASERMDERSRIHFHRIYTVEHNVKVYDFGQVADEYISRLLYQYKVAWDTSNILLPAGSTPERDKSLRDRIHESEEDLKQAGTDVEELGKDEKIEGDNEMKDPLMARWTEFKKK